MLVKKFQKFSRRGRFVKSSKADDTRSDSSSRDYKKRTCHKCKKPGHYITDCPQWAKESKKKKYKDDSLDDSKKEKKSSKSSSSKSSKSSSHKKSSSKKAWAFIGKEMDSEAESEEHEEEEASEESDSGVASLALATANVSKSIFNTEENGFPNTADDGNDDYAPTYCFMAKGAKVLKYPSSESSEDESDDNLKPNYSKLANIAVKQQKALEKVQNMLDKSDDLLGEEMDRTQTLTDNLQQLQSKFDNLQGHHETLLADHEKLSYEFLQRKQDLEKLRVSHEDLQKENDSLLTPAGITTPSPVETLRRSPPMNVARWLGPTATFTTSESGASGTGPSTSVPVISVPVPDNT
jgi:hypothetical protein